MQVSRNEYTITDWIPFYSAPETKTFYSIDKYKTSLRPTDESNIALRLMIGADPKINVYETTFLSFLEVMGTIGGIYEIVYLFFSLIFRVFVNSIFKSVFVRKIYQRSNQKEWFSYPPSLVLSQMTKDKKRKVANIEEEKIPQFDRSRNYQSYDQIEQEVR